MEADFFDRAHASPDVKAAEGVLVTAAIRDIS